MVNLDWKSYDPNASGFVTVEPGVHYVEILEAQEKRSRTSNALMFSLLLGHVGTGKKLCFDNIMLEGGGQNIGLGKLVGLGFKDVTQVDSSDLVGRRAYAVIQYEESQDAKGNVRERASVNINGGTCGYWPDGQAPEEFQAKGDVDEDSEVPF